MPRHLIVTFARDTTVAPLDRQHEVVNPRKRGACSLVDLVAWSHSLRLAIDMLVAKPLLNDHAAQQLGAALR